MVLCTDGLAADIRNSATVRAWLAESWEFESRRAGLGLAEAFHQGAQPQAVSAGIALRSGEKCFGVVAVRFEEFFETDAQWTHKHGGCYGGGLVGLAALRAAQSMGNASRKSRAMRAAAAQWRAVEDGHCYPTRQEDH